MTSTTQSGADQQRLHEVDGVPGVRWRRWDLATLSEYFHGDDGTRVPPGKEQR